MKAYNRRTRHYVMIAGEPYAIDTLREIERAAKALWDAGEDEAPVWHGHPDSPDSYRDTAQKVFASGGEV